MKNLADFVEKVDTSGPDADGSFTYIDLTSVDSRLKQVTAPRVLPVAEAPSRARQRVRTGDILVSTVRPRLNTVAQVGPQLDGAIATTAFCVLRPSGNELASRYLFHWVRSQAFIAKMVRRATGENSTITDSIVRESKLPVPAITEQRRIANILDWADKLRIKRLRALALIDELAESIFVDMFEGTQSWPEAPLADLVREPLVGGVSRSATGQYRGLVLAPAAITRGDFDASAVRETEFDRPLEAAQTVMEGDLVICRRNHNPQLVGRAELAPALTGVALADTMVAARLDEDVVDRHYAKAAFGRPAARWQLEAGMRTTGSPKVEQDVLEGIRLPVPPRQLQREYANRVAALSSFLDRQQRNATGLDELFTSLQHRAFAGQL